MRHRAARMTGAICLVVTLGVGRAEPVAAECDGPIPSFREVARTARTILIGDVVAVHRGGLTDGADGGRWSRFTLDVRYVVRGSAGDTFKVRDMPTTPCAPVIIARRGDRVAMALDGSAFDPAMRVNTAAWIRGEPPFAGPDQLTEFEAVTQDEVFLLAGMDPPETHTVPPVAMPDPPSTDPSPWLEILLAVTGAMFVLVARRTRA